MVKRQHQAHQPSQNAISSIPLVESCCMHVNCLDDFTKRENPPRTMEWKVVENLDKAFNESRIGRLHFCFRCRWIRMCIAAIFCRIFCFIEMISQNSCFKEFAYEFLMSPRSKALFQLNPKPNEKSNRIFKWLYSSWSLIAKKVFFSPNAGNEYSWFCPMCSNSNSTYWIDSVSSFD